MTSFVCIFMVDVWPGVSARCSCIRKSRFSCTIYCVGVYDIVDIIRHIYNVGLIGLS